MIEQRKEAQMNITTGNTTNATTIDTSTWPCPDCSHPNNEHGGDGQCSKCLCWRRTTYTLIGPGT
jgi:hypothetical protein